MCPNLVFTFVFQDQPVKNVCEEHIVFVEKLTIHALGRESILKLNGKYAYQKPVSCDKPNYGQSVHSNALGLEI